MRRCARTLVRANGSPLVQGRPLTRGPRDSARTPIPSCEESLAHARTTPLTPNKPPPPNTPHPLLFHAPWGRSRFIPPKGGNLEGGGIWGGLGEFGGVPESLGGSPGIWGTPGGVGGVSPCRGKPRRWLAARPPGWGRGVVGKGVRPPWCRPPSSLRYVWGAPSTTFLW